VHSRRRLSVRADDVTNPQVTPPALQQLQPASRTAFLSARPPARLTSRARSHCWRSSRPPTDPGPREADSIESVDNLDQLDGIAGHDIELDCCHIMDP
jgi:hypothetical protein